MSPDVPLTQSHAQGEDALLHTLEIIYYRNKAKEESVFCLDFTLSCLEVKEFADLELPGLMLCHCMNAALA